MRKLIYVFSIVLFAADCLILLGLAGASDTGAPMTDILPRAVLCLVCFGICSALSHAAKN